MEIIIRLNMHRCCGLVQEIAIDTEALMSEVNYRRNGQKYSSSGHCWGLSPKVGKVKVEDPNAPKPKPSRERRAMKKGK